MKFIVFSIVAFVSVWTVSCDKNRFNQLVDEVIWEMEKQMINKSQTVVSLPQISQKFSEKLLFFNVDFSMNMSGATVRNLSTIERVGDVLPVQNATTGALSIEGTFSMKELSAHAEHFNLKAGFIHVNDPLTVIIGKNAASFKVTLTFDENFNCKSSLNFARISQLGDFKISLGESGFLTGVEDDIANFVMDRLAPTLQQAINQHIYQIVNSSIQKLDLCSKLM